MYHYILLFINKVLYYIRIPFLHIENPFCDFVIVIVWLGIKAPPTSTASPDPSERRGVQVRKYFAENYQIKSPALIPRVRIGTPLPSEGSGEAVGLGEASVYLSVKQIVTKVFAELVTPVPQKTIAFWIKLLTFANREQKPANSPSRPPRNLWFLPNLFS